MVKGRDCFRHSLRNDDLAMNSRRFLRKFSELTRFETDQVIGEIEAGIAFGGGGELFEEGGY